MLINHFRQEVHPSSELTEQMFSLRARAFSDRRSWRVVVENGHERDRFDDLDPLYVCVVDDGRLIASLRLLPTLGPHMLVDVFPEVMGQASILRDRLIWESSRFCVDTEAARWFGVDGINVITRTLLGGMFEAAKNAGIKSIISVYDLSVERILRRAGCHFDRLGPPVNYDGLNTVAGLFDVSRSIENINITTSRRPADAIKLKSFRAIERL